jgi:NO-binding membrane sensor protein with MHYT domain
MQRETDPGVNSSLLFVAMATAGLFALASALTLLGEAAEASRRGEIEWPQFLFMAAVTAGAAFWAARDVVRLGFAILKKS